MFYSLQPRPWNSGEFDIGLAKSSSPTGPFTDYGQIIGDDETGGGTIDASFAEHAGTPYMFWGSFQGIYVGELSSDLQSYDFGYHVYATSDDEDAALMAGINTDRVKLLNFVLAATLAAFAGVVSISYYGSMFGSAGIGFELLIIAAVVIGDTNLFGGEGTLLGMVIGAMVIGIIPVVLVLNGLSVEIQEFLTGVVIILAVVLDIAIRR